MEQVGTIDIRHGVITGRAAIPEGKERKPKFNVSKLPEQRSAWGWCDSAVGKPGWCGQMERKEAMRIEM